MEENKSTRKEKCDKIIRNHVIWSAGAGLIPLPLMDMVIVSSLQLEMVRRLSLEYDIDFNKTEGKALISALAGVSLTRFIARGVKLIPGVGTVLGSVTVSVLSGATSYALGRVFIKHFESGGNFMDFDPREFKTYFEEQFEKGKEYANNLYKNKEKADEDIQDADFREGDFDEGSDETYDANMEGASTPESGLSDEPSRKSTTHDTLDQETINNIKEKLRKLHQLKENGLINDMEYKELMTKYETMLGEYTTDQYAPNDNMQEEEEQPEDWAGKWQENSDEDRNENGEEEPVDINKEKETINDMITIKGKLVYNDLEGGFWGIEAADGKKYHINSGLPDDMKQSDIIVEAQANRSGALNIQMWGINIDIQHIKEI